MAVQQYATPKPAWPLLIVGHGGHAMSERPGVDQMPEARPVCRDSHVRAVCHEELLEPPDRLCRGRAALGQHWTPATAHEPGGDRVPERTTARDVDHYTLPDDEVTERPSEDPADSHSQAVARALPITIVHPSPGVSRRDGVAYRVVPQVA